MNSGFDIQYKELALVKFFHILIPNGKRRSYSFFDFDIFKRLEMFSKS